MNMRLFLIIFLGISLILCFIGIITHHWYENSQNKSSEGLWSYCQKTTSNSSSSSTKTINCYGKIFFKSQLISILGFILLLIGFILSIIYLIKKSDRLFSYLIVFVLLGSTLLLIFSYLLYPRNPNLREFGYSLYLMLISSLIVLFTTGLVTFTARTIQSTTIYRS